MVLCFGECDEVLKEYDYCDGQKKELKLDWKISLRSAGEQEFTDYPVRELKNLAHVLPDFGGEIRYEAEWNVEEAEHYLTLELSNVGETAQLWINDSYCGAVVAKPYRFTIDGKLKRGKNQLCIQVVSNLAYRERDEFSSYLPLPPIGVTGRVYATFT